jgi:hypothetical protein
MFAKFTLETSSEFRGALLGDTELDTTDISEDGQ